MKEYAKKNTIQRRWINANTPFLNRFDVNKGFFLCINSVELLSETFVLRKKIDLDAKTAGAAGVSGSFSLPSSTKMLIKKRLQLFSYGNAQAC